MGEKLKLNMFGHFVFDLVKKSKYGTVRIPCDIEGAEIVDIDHHHLCIKGFDGVMYIPLKSNVKSFETMERPVKI